MLSATKRVTAFLPRNLQQLRQLHEDIEENIYFYKSRGQHILTNPRVLDTIVRKSAINPSDTVLEIGPGTGNLTLKLLEASREVVAIEIDQRMVNILENRALKRGLRNKLTVSFVFIMYFTCSMKCLVQNTHNTMKCIFSLFILLVFSNFFGFIMVTYILICKLFTF